MIDGSGDQAAEDLQGCLAVVGPPAVGKSSLVEQLADAMSVEVFRLREFAQAYRRRPGVDQGLFASTDALGWYTDHTVAILLKEAFQEASRLGCWLLKAFPAAQLS
ncbi:MAG TPA: hypothetical protein VHU91_10095 [Mycobacteriales bacterium]|jgi:GTPase SAR1 family protein|nr:hypothetical protein [Mycobacteriales bacterium]